jgi:hypothetical protein
MSVPRCSLPARLRALAFALLVAAAAAGCGLFDTAVPELPEDNVSIPPDFATPESLLATLERAVERQESSNYFLCYTDSVGADQPGFYASFDPADVAQYENDGNVMPALWTLEDEIEFFPQFLDNSAGAFYEMTISPDPINPDILIDDQSRVLNRRYRVFAGTNTVAAGSAGLTIVRVGQAGEWKIRFWEDRRDTAGVRTWGTARLERG